MDSVQKNTSAKWNADGLIQNLHLVFNDDNRFATNTYTFDCVYKLIPLYALTYIYIR